MPQPPNESHRIQSAASVVAAATILSRLLGFVRDAVIAWRFGASLSSDAFFAAFRIPHLLRRLFAEGALTVTFVPAFTDTLLRQGAGEAAELAGAAYRLLAVSLSVFVAVGVVGAAWMVRGMAPGFAPGGEAFTLTVVLTRVMLPYVLFIGLTALSMGVLNACGRFAAPALAPVVLNLSIIGSVVFLAPHLKAPVLGPAIGVAAGGVLQLALQWPWLRRCGMVLRPRGRLGHPALAGIGRRLPPAVIGAAVFQINVWIDTILASLLGEGNISYLYYADRLVQFPLGIVAVAAATAALPSFSRQAASGDMLSLGRSLYESLRVVMFLTLPAMVGLLVLRRPIVAVLFGRGAFGPETVDLTASAVLYYGIGLWAFSGARLVVSAFFAMKDTRIPFAAACAAVVVNVLFGIVLMKPLGCDGLALSTSLAAAVQFSLLVFAVGRRFDGTGRREWLLSGMRVLVCAGIMGLAVHLTASRLAPDGVGMTAGSLAVCVLVGVAVFGALSLVWKLPELHTLAGSFRKAGKQP